MEFIIFYMVSGKGLLKQSVPNSRLSDKVVHITSAHLWRLVRSLTRVAS